MLGSANEVLVVTSENIPKRTLHSYKSVEVMGLCSNLSWAC